MDSRLLGGWLILLGLVGAHFAAAQAPVPVPARLQASEELEFGAQVIYGEDGRSEVFEVSDPVLREAAASTVAIFSSALLLPIENGDLDLEAKTVGEAKKLCADERFADQPTGASCSGFLVGPDLIATAGHCIDAETCSAKSFVFGYRVLENGSAQRRFTTNDVYKCQKLLGRGVGGVDWALVKLDRPVRDRTPLRLAARAPEPLDDLAVIGHPMGLPAKVALGGRVRQVGASHFVASLDTYSGNSGSAVFDLHTLEVVGILVRGETDLVTDRERSCRKSLRCEQDSCRGEDVTHIRFVQQTMR